MKTTNTSYDILGVMVNAVTMDQAVKQIVDFGESTGKASYVTKPYVEFFSGNFSDPHTRVLLNNSALCLPDGVSAQWASAYLYNGRHNFLRAFYLAVSIVLNPSRISKPMPEKFGGANFTWQLLEHCASQDCSVYLVGSPKNSSIEKTAEHILAKLPKLKIVGTWPGHWRGLGGDSLRSALRDTPVEAALVKDLRRSKPDIILIGMGFPLQEELMAKLRPQLNHGVMVGEGGTFDYESFGGVRPRAPHWVQRTGLEWAWRLILEPKRLSRQFAIPRFMLAVWRQGRGTGK